MKRATIAIAFFAFCSFAAAVLQFWALLETNRIAAIAQRPYLTATDIQISEGQLPGYWMFDVLVSNSGGTPTREMRYLTLSTSAPLGDPADYFDNPPKPFWVKRGLIAPGATNRLVFGTNGVPKSVLEKMARHRQAQYLYGVIYYRSQSETSGLYVTKYCFSVHPVMQGDKLIPQYNQCAYWNCMDADCEADKREYEQRAKAKRSKSR